MGSNKWVFAIVFLTLSLGAYQNCGELGGSGSNQQSSVVPQDDQDTTELTTEDTADVADIVDDIGDVVIAPPADPTPEPVMFAAGEAYSLQKLPFRFTDNATLNRLANYPTRLGFKAMAFTQDGDLYIGVTENALVTGQAEWDQLVLERCQLENVGKLCSLYASGATIAQNRVDFFNNFVNRITVPTQFDPSLVPGHLFYWRERNTYNTFTQGEFKSYSVGARGAATAGWSRVNQADATRRSLELCEALSNQPCTLYAVARNVVFNLNTYQFEPQRVFYAPLAFNVDQIPFITGTDRETVRTAWNRARTLNRRFALAMDRYGRVYFEERAQAFTPQQLEAMRQTCTSRINDGSNRTCFIYSVDTDVVMTRQSWVDANNGL